MVQKSTYRILYLEQDRSLAQQVQKQLQWLGHNFAITDDELAFLQQVRNSAVDLLIINYSTPRDNALNLLDNLRISGNQIPALLVLNTANSKIINLAIKQGFIDYIVKDAILHTYIEHMHCRIFKVLDRLPKHSLELSSPPYSERHESQSNFKSLLANTFLEATSDAVFFTNEQQQISFINNKFSEITGYSREQIIGQNIAILNSGTDIKHKSKQIDHALQQHNFWQGELSIRLRNGKNIPVWQSITEKKDPHGRTLNSISIFRDISQEKKLADSIKFQANYDDLTKLPNRNLFFDRLSSAIKRALRNNHHLALLAMDLDKFKWINDSLGHHAGDQLLQITAKKLLNSVRESDTVARLGGDEFCIILPELEKSSVAEIISSKIFQTFSEPVVIEGRELYISCSIGIAIFPDDGGNVELLQKNADQAMYSAKADSAKNTYRFYTRSMQERMEKRQQLLASMEKSISNNEFSINYQPIFDVSNNTIISAEALLRWDHPASGNIAPGDFIPLAEESGLIRPLGYWVVNQVAKDMKRWKKSGFKPINISINKSAAQFSNNDCENEWLKILDNCQIPADCITIEITEDIFIEQSNEKTQRIEKLQSQGFKISLDSFGTGYLSLSHLNRNPVNTLKIDRSFIHDMMDNANHAALIDTIITLADKIGISVIATGIENKQQLQHLNQHCHYLQGYYLSRPLPLNKFENVLQASAM